MKADTENQQNRGGVKINFDTQKAQLEAAKKTAEAIGDLKSIQYFSQSLANLEQQKQATANPHQITSKNERGQYIEASFWGSVGNLAFDFAKHMLQSEEQAAYSNRAERRSYDIKMTGAEDVALGAQEEVVRLFDPSDSADFITFEQTKYYEDFKNSGQAKIFEGLSQLQIFQYFKELTAQTGQLNWNYKYHDSRLEKNSPHILLPQYAYIKTNHGSFNLRNYSYSDSDTDAKWTIEIPPKLLETSLGKMPSGANRVELKFR